MVRDALSLYTGTICELHDLGIEWGLTNEEIDEILRNAIEELQNSQPEIVTKSFFQRSLSFLRFLGNLVWIFLKFISVSFIVLIVGYCILVCHNPTQRFVTQHTQNLIYPTMRSIRQFSLPIVNYFPSLTDWYDETCLIHNPFFRVPNINCKLCENVEYISHISAVKNFSQVYHQNGIPFVVTDAINTEITFASLRCVYLENTEKIDSGASRISSTNDTFSTAKDLFSILDANEIAVQKELHILWHIKRAVASRVIRDTFPRPYFIPDDTEVSVQRYIFIDGSKAQENYLPVTEFANVWVTQGSGTKTVILEPSDQCSEKCKTLSVIIKPKDILFYNWQYWRPKFGTGHTDENLSISFIGSFY